MRSAVSSCLLPILAFSFLPRAMVVGWIHTTCLLCTRSRSSNCLAPHGNTCLRGVSNQRLILVLCLALSKRTALNWTLLRMCVGAEVQRCIRAEMGANKYSHLATPGGNTDSCGKGHRRHWVPNRRVQQPTALI